MLTLESYLTGFSSRSDGSASLRFTTQELSSDEFKLLKDSLNAFGWLCFKENIIPEIPQEPAEEDKDKSPSKRLRAVLFIQWKQEKPFSDFESWYRKEMEIYIDKIKEKLE